MRVAADRGIQEEIMKACNEGIGSLQDSRVLASHFDRDKIGAMVTAR